MTPHFIWNTKPVEGGKWWWCWKGRGDWWRGWKGTGDISGMFSSIGWKMVKSSLVVVWTAGCKTSWSVPDWVMKVISFLWFRLNCKWLVISSLYQSLMQVDTFITTINWKSTIQNHRNVTVNFTLHCSLRSWIKRKTIF